MRKIQEMNIKSEGDFFFFLFFENKFHSFLRVSQERRWKVKREKEYHWISPYFLYHCQIGTLKINFPRRSWGLREESFIKLAYNQLAKESTKKVWFSEGWSSWYKKTLSKWQLYNSWRVSSKLAKTQWSRALYSKFSRGRIKALGPEASTPLAIWKREDITNAIW